MSPGVRNVRAVGHLEHRGGDRWRITVATGWDADKQRYGRIRKPFVGTKAEAQGELDRLEGGGQVGPETMGALFDAWLAHVRVGRRTRADYERVVRAYLRPAFGPRRPERITALDLDRFYDSLTVGPARIQRVHSVMSLALQQGVRWRWLAMNPALHASPPAVPAPEIVLPPDGAVPAIIERALGSDPPQLDLVALIRLGVNTGARCGELCALRWPDVDARRSTLRIARAIEEVKGYLGAKETKTRRERTIAVPAEIVGELRSQKIRAKEAALAWGLEWSEDSYIFRTWPDDKPWRPNTTSQRFSALRDELGYADFTVHSLRHQMATTLLAEGVDPATIAGRGGWANAATFLRYYAHFVPAKDQGAAEMLGRLLG